MAVLKEFNELIDERGRFVGPLIERGSDEVPNIVDVPSVSDLKGFSSKNPDDVNAMSGLLHRFGFPAPDQMIEQQQKYLAGFGITPNSQNYEQQMSRLRGDLSGRFLLGISRRTQEQYQTLKAIDGNLSTEMIRIAEGDDPCDRCEPLDGTIDTYAGHVKNGTLPGGTSCEGGDNCLCVMFPLE